MLYPLSYARICSCLSDHSRAARTVNVIAPNSHRAPLRESRRTGLLACRSPAVRDHDHSEIPIRLFPYTG